MPNNNETTTKFKVDISELKSQFQEAQRTIRIANSEFKAATAGMDRWSDSADGLSAKIKQLNGVLDGEKAKLESLERQYELTAKEQGETSKGAQELLIKINNQKAAIANAEKQIKNYNSKLDEMESSANETKSATDKLSDEIADQEDELSRLKNAYKDVVLEQGKNSKEAKSLSKQISNLSDDLKDNKKEMDKAEKAADSFDNTLDDLGDSAKEASDGFTVFKGAVAGFAGNIATNIVGAAKDGISSIMELAESTREYRSIMGSLENSSKRAGYSVEQTADIYGTLNGVLGDTQSAATTTANLQAIGLEQGKLQKLTEGVIGAWATYGDSIPIDGLAEAVNETVKVGQVTGGMADVLNWAGLSEDKFNESLENMSSEAERADYILQMFSQMGLTQAGQAWEKNNESIVKANQAQADFEEQTAKLGEKIEPVTTSLKEGFNKLLEKVLELVEGVDMEEFTSKIEDGFEVLTNDVIPAVKDGFGWILDNKDEIIAGLAGIAAGFVAFKVVSIIQGVVNAMKGMTLAQAALNLVMSMNPIGLLVAAIAGLVTAFVVLWNKCDWFREFWIGLWESIQEVLNEYFGFWLDGWSMIIDFFKKLWDDFQEVFQLGMDMIVKFFTETIPNAWNSFVEAFQLGIDTIVNFFKTSWDNIKNTFANVKEWFSEKFTSAKDAVMDAFSNIGKWFSNRWTDITNVFSNVGGWFRDKFSNAWTNIKNVFSSVGEFFGGMWETIKEKFTDIGTKVADAIGGAFKSAINAVISVVEGAINTIPTAINNAIDLINDLPGVEISKMSTISLPRLAKGGIVSKPTIAEIGEDGKEAVIPLERNLGWIRELARKLADEVTKIYHVREASQSTVNNYFYQTNNSPKPLNRLEIYRQSKNLLNMKG